MESTTLEVKAVARGKAISNVQHGMLLQGGKLLPACIQEGGYSMAATPCQQGLLSLEVAAEPHLSESRAPSPAVQGGTRLQGGRFVLPYRSYYQNSKKMLFIWQKPISKMGFWRRVLIPFYNRSRLRFGNMKRRKLLLMSLNPFL